MYEDLGNVKTDVEIIKRDITSIQAYSAKIDDAIEKMAEVSNSISKMLIVHEHKLQNHDQLIDGIKLAMLERKNDFDKQVDTLHTRITDMKKENHTERERYHKELMSALKDIADSQKSLDDRITNLETWKWYVMGATAVIAAIAAIIPWDALF